MDDSHKVVGYPLPHDQNNARADRSTAKTCQCDSPMGLPWGQMNEINWSVMKSRFDRGNQCTEFPATSSLWLKLKRMPGALAAEPQASAEAKAMPKVGRLALAAEKAAKPNKIPTQPPPKRRIGVMTAGVQFCLRCFMEGQRTTAGEDLQRLKRQAQQHGQCEWRGPTLDEGDVESAAATM